MELAWVIIGVGTLVSLLIINDAQKKARIRLEQAQRFEIERAALERDNAARATAAADALLAARHRELITALQQILAALEQLKPPSS